LCIGFHVWRGKANGKRDQGERFFELFLLACAAVHVLYMFFLVVLVVSFAIFFGVTGGIVLTIVGAVILPVALLAAMPEDEEGSLNLP